MSPELVLVDAALSEELRHLLVVPEDTLERLLARQTDRCRPEEVAPLLALGNDDKTEAELTDHHVLVKSSEDDLANIWQHPTGWCGTSPTAPPAELADLVLMKEAVFVDPGIERTTPDQGPHQINTYPALPAPPPEDAQEDATNVVLRVITRSA